MKKNLIIILSLALLLSGCAGEFNKVFKTTDYDYRYEYAKQCFAEGKYSRAVTLLSDVITLKKGTEEAQESLYMLGMSEYMSGDHESASATSDISERTLCRACFLLYRSVTLRECP